MIAQRTRKGIAMRAKLAAWRQHRKHSAVDAWNRIQQLDGFWAQPARRRQELVVPFQVKALPAAFEKGIKAPVVVLRSRPDEPLVEQPHRLVTDRLPIVTQGCKFRELVNRDNWFVRHG